MWRRRWKSWCSCGSCCILKWRCWRHRVIVIATFIVFITCNYMVRVLCSFVNVTCCNGVVKERSLLVRVEDRVKSPGRHYCYCCCCYWIHWSSYPNLDIKNGSSWVDAHSFETSMKCIAYVWVERKRKQRKRDQQGLAAIMEFFGWLPNRVVWPCGATDKVHQPPRVTLWLKPINFWRNIQGVDSRHTFPH